MKIDIQAAVLSKLKKPLQLLSMYGGELKDGQVLVKIIYSGVCGSQLMEIDGFRGKDPYLPHCLGHEASGIVIACGNRVSKVKVKDKVILTWLKCSGIDAENPKYYSKERRKINSGKITTFSNYTIVSENRIVKKPKTLDMKEAVLYGCALPTGFGMVVNQVKPLKKNTILLIGLGGIGISSLLALKCLNHKKVIVADINQKKINLAKKLGFNNTINMKKINLKNFIKTNYKDGIDICIESAGKVKTIELGFSLIKYNGGRIFFASHPKNNDKLKILPHELIKGKEIFGSWGGQTNPDKDIPIFANLIKKSNVSLSELIQKTYDLKHINRAIKDLKEGKVFRPIIKMSHHE